MTASITENDAISRRSAHPTSHVAAVLADAVIDDAEGGHLPRQPQDLHR